MTRKSYANITLIFCFLGFLILSALNPAAGSPPETGYVIGVGEILEIQVWDNEDLHRKVEVSQDGAFTFPLIGQVHAAGLSVFELEILLKKKLADGYLIAPQVTVTVAEYESQKIFIYGEVKKPGSYVIKQTGMTVRQAISLAGGPSQRGALQRTKIIRVSNGTEKEIKPGMSDQVMPGDIIKVPESYF
jgi:protein involved in polysaccharide export with SLBB domain